MANPTALDIIRTNIDIIRKLTFEARELLRHFGGFGGKEAAEKLDKIISIIDGNSMTEG